MMRRSRSENGFTLVELLVAITALGIIMVPLSAGIIIGYRTVDETSYRLTGSSDAQFVAAYLPADIKSADTGTTSGITCSGVSNAQLQLTSSAYGGGSFGAVVVVYWIKTVTGGFQLVRSVCTTGTAAQSIVVARSLVSVTSVTVTSIVVATALRGYTMTVTEKKAASDTTAAYQYTVSGRFRTGIPT